MESKPTRVILPEFALTETCNEGDPGAVKISLPDGSSYYYRPKLLPTEAFRPDGVPKWAPREFSVYPLVMQADGAPWDEANVWILSMLEEEYNFNMTTYRGKADDLQHFRNFLDSRGIDWTVFPDQKLLRPTYRYRGYLRVEIEAGGMQWSTAMRRMSAVINLYRWLIERKRILTTTNEPWMEWDAYIPATDKIGRPHLVKRKTTDVSIKRNRDRNPFDDRIDDGGKLRPLPAQEQAWIMDALSHLRNTEQALIQTFALSTGARIQTVLTLRLRHVLIQYPPGSIRLLCGPGTGIDTKGDIRLTLDVPHWLMNQLRTYALSDRGTNRRLKAPGGDVDNQYLFLTERGSPMYEAKQSQDLSGGKKLRHVKNGQAVRSYMSEFIIPFIRKRHDSDFTYQFHDLRASFGMNLVDEYKPKMDAGEITYTKVLGIVQARMSHSSPVVTERYLQYRGDRKLYDGAQDQWESKLERFVSKLMEAA